jgi:RNA polymerase sigma-70 factor (ECF subfamily)
LATWVTQDAFSRLFPIWTKFGGGHARHWLIRTVTGSCREQLQSGLRSCPSLAAEDDGVQACFNALPPEQRITLVLADIQGLSYREIAKTTGVAIGIVKSRLSRGRSRLWDELLARGVLLDVLLPAPPPRLQVIDSDRIRNQNAHPDLGAMPG